MRLRIFVLTLFFLLLAPLSARADEKAEYPAPTVSIRFNPAALAIGRVSGEGEVWFTRHFSVVGTFFHAKWHEEGGSYEEDDGDIDEHSVQLPSSELVLTGFELGARYTSLDASSGPHVRIGAFAGAMLGPAWGRWSLGDSTRGVSQLTGAIEGGGMMLVGPVILEAGFGLQATHDFKADPKVSCGDAYICVSTTHWYYGSGFTPRILLSVGFVL